MRSWSLRPPYVLFGVPSCTVAKDRACVLEGKATRARALVEAADGAEVLDNIFCRSIIYKLFARSRTGIIRLGVGGVKAEIEKSEGVGGTPGRLREEVVVVVKEKWKYSVLCN